jgi:hypothetical protein
MKELIQIKEEQTRWLSCRRELGDVRAEKQTPTSPGILPETVQNALCDVGLVRLPVAAAKSTKSVAVLDASPRDAPIPRTMNLNSIHCSIAPQGPNASERHA